MPPQTLTPLRLWHAQEAIDHSSINHADALVTHANTPLSCVKTWQKEVSNPRLDAGIKEQVAAITYGKQGHTDMATGQAKSTLGH